MNRILVIGLVFLLFTGLGAAKDVSDIRSGQTQEVSDVPASQHDEFDSEEKMQEISVKGGTISNTVLAGLVEKDQVKRGTFVAMIGQLDDRKQVNLHPHKLFEEVRVGSADAARKEIAVKMQSGKKEKSDGVQKFIIRLAKSDENQIGSEVSAISKRSARKGRNPQTGKEIKIPSKIHGKNTNAMHYTTPVVEHLNTVKDEVTFELREGRKGMNAIDVRRTD